MNQKLRRGGYVTFVIAMVFAVVVAGAGGAAAAPPTVDAETTDTSSQSEMNNGDTIGENNTFNANSSKATVLQYEADSNESKVYITRNGSDARIYENASANLLNWTGASGHYNVSVNHGQLADLERGINSNVTLDVTMLNNTTSANANTTTIQVYVESDNSTTVEAVETSDIGDNGIATLTESNFTVAGFTIDSLSDDHTKVETNSRAVDGRNTTVTLSLQNASVAEDYSNAASGASSGDLMLSMATTLESGNDTTVPAMVYYKEAPDSVSNDTTYGVYKENVGGEPAIVFHLGSEFEGASSASVNSYGNAGFWEQRSVYGTLTVITGGAVNFKVPMPLSMSGGASLAGGVMSAFLMGAPVGRRRDVEDAIIVDDEEE